MENNHTTIRNNQLFCANCGAKKALIMPALISDLIEKIDQFNLLHKHCPKTWELPKPNPEQTIEERANFWFEHGERGLSSEAIFYFFTKKPGFANHPRDPADFKRCLGLFQFVPEWKERILELSSLSPHWKALAENWAELEALFLKAKESNRQKDWEDMYQFMKAINKGLE